MISDDIVPLLAANHVGEFGVDLFWGTLPSAEEPADDPDPTVALYETPGPGGTFAKDGMASDEARLQVLVRALKYEDAMAKALEVYELFNDRRETLGGTRYGIRPNQRPFDVGSQDDHGRTIISCNYTVKMRAS